MCSFMSVTYLLCMSTRSCRSAILPKVIAVMHTYRIDLSAYVQTYFAHHFTAHDYQLVCKQKTAKQVLLSHDLHLCG